MFEKSVKEDLLKIKENSKNKYISFLNDGTLVEDDGKYVLSTSNDKLNDVCSNIDSFLKRGTDNMTLLTSDFDELKFCFKMGIIFNKNCLGENNEILPTSICLDNKARYYTDNIEAYKNGTLINKITTDKMINYQGFIDYDELIKTAKKEDLILNGPKSFEELKEVIINNKKEDISLSVDFNKEKNLELPKNNIKRKKLSLFKK